MDTVPSAEKHRRPLSAFEMTFVRPAPVHMALDVRLRGALDLDVLLRAFEVLRQEYAEISARVVVTRGSFELVVDGESLPARSLFRAREGDLEAGIEPDFDIRKSLSALDVVTSGDRHRVLLWVSHVIGDGARYFSMFHRLWSVYGVLAAGGSVDAITPHGIPVSPEETLSGRLEGLGADVEADLDGVEWSGSETSIGSLIDGGLRVMMLKSIVPETVFTDFRAAAKSVGCTVTGLIVGAVAVAERRAFEDGGERGAIPMGFNVPFDMRSRVSPPVGLDDVTSFASSAPIRLDVAYDSDPISLGRSAAEQIQQALEGGALARQLLGKPLLTRYKNLINVDNIGMMPEIKLPPQLVVEEITEHLAPDVRAMLQSAVSSMLMFDLRVPRRWAQIFAKGLVYNRIFPILAKKIFAKKEQSAEAVPPMGSSYWFISHSGSLSVQMANPAGSIQQKSQERIFHDVVSLIEELSKQSPAL